MILRLAAPVALVLALAACAPRAHPAPEGVLTLTATEQTATWIRNFNPLAPGSRWPADAGIYEPLAIYNSAAGRWVEWLSDSWEWLDDGLTLRFHVREGVLWSDGRPFTGADVAFTFQLLKKHPALDQRSVWKKLTSVTQEGGAITFVFQKPFVPGFGDIAQQPIVPEHVWTTIADPVTFTNPTPIATGPFTEIRLFQPQVYEIARNPHYWQKGKPAVEAIRLPAFPGNDQANMALVDGELDWAANFVPSIQRVYVRRNPEHHRYWFPSTGSTVFLYPNNAKAPFDDRRVRKAISRAIDRELLVDVAMARYTHPADATGLSASYDAWRDAEAVAEGDWVRFDKSVAERALDEAGLKRGPDGWRRFPDGRPFEPTIAVVNGWTDWVRASQVISRQLESVGIRASVRLNDLGAWFERLQKGDFDLAVAWSIEGPTPYEFYRWLMHPATVSPLGQAVVGNWHRYGSEAAVEIFDALERTREPGQERALESRLQKLFVEEAPAIPLFPNPSWGEFNTSRFEGFPDAENPWAALSPNKKPECLLVLTELRPRKGAGR